MLTTASKAVVCRGLCRGWQCFAVDDVEDGFDARDNARVELARLEQRRDGIADDAFRDCIRQRAFQPIADFYAHAAIFHCDQQQHAIVDLGASELPFVNDANAVLLDVLRCRAVYQ